MRYVGSTMHVDLLDREGNVIGTTLVDRRDRPLVEDRKWNLNKRTGYVYSAGRGGGLQNVYMHRLIAGTWGTKMWTDHKNGDKLDNRRANLRAVNAVQSQVNKRTKRGELRGIYKNGPGNWTATVSRTFHTIEEAQVWRDAVNAHVHGIDFMKECGLWSEILV